MIRRLGNYLTSKIDEDLGGYLLYGRHTFVNDLVRLHNRSFACTTGGGPHASRTLSSAVAVDGYDGLSTLIQRYFSELSKVRGRCPRDSMVIVLAGAATTALLP